MKAKKIRRKKAEVLKKELASIGSFPSSVLKSDTRGIAIFYKHKLITSFKYAS